MTWVKPHKDSSNERQINQMVGDFLSHRVSRRTFVHSLATLGISAVGIESIFRSAEAVAQGVKIPLRGGPPVARQFTGTGGEVMVEQMKAAGIRYLFTNPGSFEVAFFDAFLDQPMKLILGLHEGIVIAMADGYHKVSPRQDAEEGSLRDPGYARWPVPISIWTTAHLRSRL